LTRHFEWNKILEGDSKKMRKNHLNQF